MVSRSGSKDFPRQTGTFVKSTEHSLEEEAGGRSWKHIFQVDKARAFFFFFALKCLVLVTLHQLVCLFLVPFHVLCTCRKLSFSFFQASSNIERAPQDGKN